MRMVLALLRAADALDSRRLDPPTLRFRAADDVCTSIAASSRSLGKAKKIFRRRKKFKLLEKLAGCKVQMRIRTGELAAA